MLSSTVQCLLHAGLAPSTQQAYLAGIDKYLAFCPVSGSILLPVSEVKLIKFMAALVNQGLRQQTIKCYLLALHHLQIEDGGGHPRVESLPLLELTPWGAKCEQAGVPTRF